jgi:hypothetical protein
MPLRTSIPFTLQSASTNIGNGDVANVANIDELHLSITGNASGFTVNFEASFDGTNYEAIIGYKGSDSSDATSASNNSCWSFCVSPYALFRARISAISSGSVTVRADGK